MIHSKSVLPVVVDCFGNESLIAALFVASVLLLAGLALRHQTKVFAAARIPVSLLAGTIGLVLWQVVRYSFDSQPALVAFEAGPIAVLRSWPGWLIAVVFAAMLLGRPPSRARGGGVASVAREGLMVWIIVIGQTTVGLWVTWWLIQPMLDLPNSTGMLIETGFAGGHGTAAAMGTVFQNPSIDFSVGLDLGILMATAGLVYGLIAGIVCVNLGIRRRWLASDRMSVDRAPGPLQEPTSPRDGNAEPNESGMSSVSVLATGRSDGMEPLLLQLVWLSLAFGLGVAMQAGVGAIAGQADSIEWIRSLVSSLSGDIENAALSTRLGFVSVVGSFPLFIYTLFGGAIVRFLVIKLAGPDWIDTDAIARLSNVSMDLLVVAAVATLNLQAVASLWQAFALLSIAGMIWSTFCLLSLSRRILPKEHWFELGLINFGMSTGTTATGFVLLRVVDPDLKTNAAEEYALAAPLSAPFIGGGMLTVGLPLLLFERIPIASSAIGFATLLVVLITIGILWRPKLA